MANATAFDWDDEITTDSSNTSELDPFVVLPPGEYPFVVKKFERTEFKGSAKVPPCHAAHIGLVFDGGDKGRSYVTKRFYLASNCIGMIYDFLSAVGLHERGSGPTRIPWRKIEDGVGELCGRARIYTRSFSGRDGNEITTNDVKSWIPFKAEAPADEDI